MTKLHFFTNTTATVNEIESDGKAILIAPVVAIKEGVLNDMLYLTAEFSRYADSWNGRPVSLGHPKRAGEYVSANTPDIWASEVPGQLWHVYVDDDGLKGEIWIELEKAEKIGEPALEVVASLRANEPIEVSTGLFADLEETPGVWNGKSYIGIARNIRPDHLALLPNEIGACSWEDGCGTPRVNQKGERMGDEVKVNELTLDDRASLVRRAFWNSPLSFVSDEEWWDLDVISVFDSTLIAKDWSKKSHMAFPYTLTENGEVEFGTPTPVEVVYRSKEDGAEVVIANATAAKQPGIFARIQRLLKAGKVNGISVGESPINNQEVEDVTKCEMVANILANKHNKFSKEQLDGFTDATLETLRQSLPTETAQAAAPVVNEAAAPAFDLSQLTETIRSVVREEMAPVQATINANADRERAQLVATIVANSTFEADDLKGFTLEHLQKLASNFQVSDYSGGVGFVPNSNVGNELTVMPMPQPTWATAGKVN